MRATFSPCFDGKMWCWSGVRYKNRKPILRYVEETTRIGYNMFIEASFKLGRIPTVIQKLAKISSELVKSSLNSDSRFTSHLYVVNLYNKKNYSVCQNLYENDGHLALYPNIFMKKRYD